MKKLGTPIAAGPGRDSEKVGFEADGTPLPVGSFGAAGVEDGLELPLALFLCLWRFLFFFLGVVVV
jgi:hypothetical protein